MDTKAFDLSKFRKTLTKSIDGLGVGFNDPTDWISTGNYTLNYLISGDFHRGVPLGKVTVFAGESGAGKTESTKLMVQHIIHLCRNDVDKEIQKKIIEVNTLLEAFGNAQTCMNSNSSRFGKYLQMIFTEDGKILGGILSYYFFLLEVFFFK